MQNVLKSKLLIGAILAVAAVAAAAVIAVNVGHSGSGNDLQAQLDLGNKYVSELDYENAIIAYEEALKIDPYCLEAYLGLSDAYMALGQQDKALEIMEQAKNMLPDSVEVYVSLAQLYASQNQIGLVVSTLEEGIRVTDSDRLREMLREYQTDGPQLAEAETGNVSEPAEVSEEPEAEESEEERDASVAIGLRQDRDRQNTELVAAVSQDNGEIAEIPLVVPVQPVVEDENNSDDNGGGQDGGSGNSGGNDSNGENEGNGTESGPDDGSDSGNELVMPDIGIAGNVLGIDGEGIEGVTLNIYYLSGSNGAAVAENTTDAQGVYAQGLQSNRTYRCVLSKDGYVDLTYNFIVDNSLAIFNFVMLTEEESRQSASFKGIVVDAQNAQRIDGATITLLNGYCKSSDSNPGDITGSTEAGANGEFSIDDGMNAGYYTIEASKDGYSTYYHNQTMKPGENELTINMSPLIRVLGEYRIVLTWGESPRDLDSHLICTGNDNFHVYYANKNYNTQNSNASQTGYAALDVDDVTSYGPETITVKIGEGNSYVYAVHNFSDSWVSPENPNAWNLSHSSARVVVYSSEGVIFDGSVPTYEKGTTWEVFRIENGRLNVTNRVSFDYPGTSNGQRTADNADAGSPAALASLEDEAAESLPVGTESTVQASESPIASAEANAEEATESIGAGNMEAVLEGTTNMEIAETENSGTADAEDEASNAEEAGEAGNGSTLTDGEDAGQENAGTEAGGAADIETENAGTETSGAADAGIETAGPDNIGTETDGAADAGLENTDTENAGTGLENTENEAGEAADAAGTENADIGELQEENTEPDETLKSIGSEEG